MKLELKPEYDKRKSFYKKAIVEFIENKKVLYSYNTKIATVENNELVVNCKEVHLTNTTLRHLKEFMYQNNFVVLDKKGIIRKYMK